MTRFSVLGVFALASVLASAPRTAAAIVFDSFGPGNSYNISAGATIGGPGSAVGLFTSGFQFTPAESVNLSTIELAVGLISGPNSFNLALRAADGPSGGPGTLLESFLIVNQLGTFGFNNPVIGVGSVAQPLLSAGTSYWLVATAEGNTLAAWNSNNQGIRGTYYSVQGGREVLVPDQTVGAYRVSGIAAVPEPASGASLGLGLVTLTGGFWWRRVRRPALAGGTRALP